ncbi:hypothetical protein LCGC14_0541800 [marine sediment metagenome]|uniref:Uncharacterized protein n=1 Tax=marine sediment metagenome TaxID=412755 RepID=A0A0F9V0T6_9ZZZZ
MNVLKTKRGSIRQILDRKKIYNISFYARKIGRQIDRHVSKSEILSILRKMEREGQLRYSVVGSAVVGFTLKCIA